jgi:hypothetical protein
MISNALTVAAHIQVLSPKQSSTKESSVIRRPIYVLRNFNHAQNANLIRLTLGSRASLFRFLIS